MGLGLSHDFVVDVTLWRRHRNEPTCVVGAHKHCRLLLLLPSPTLLPFTTPAETTTFSFTSVDSEVGVETRGDLGDEAHQDLGDEMSGGDEGDLGEESLGEETFGNRAF